jgi:hypothetical protein
MGYATKVQSIKRKDSEQFYVGFPMQAARMLDLAAGEHVEWCIEDRETLVLQRLEAPPSPLKKKRRTR